MEELYREQAALTEKQLALAKRGLVAMAEDFLREDVRDYAAVRKTIADLNDAANAIDELERTHAHFAKRADAVSEEVSYA